MPFDLTASLAAASAAVRPSPSPSPSAPYIDPARVTPGLLGFAALLFLVVTGFFLARSMIKQFKKIDFDEEATEQGIARPAPRPDEPAPQPVAEDTANPG